MVVKVRQLKDGTRELRLDGETWHDEYAAMFVEQGCDGIVVGAPYGGPPIPDVEFLATIPGLKKVRFLRGVEDCSAVAGMPGLASLRFASDYRGPLSLRGLTGLVDLSMPYLPAVADLGALQELRELYIWFWPKAGDSFTVLGDKPKLDFLRIEFTRDARVATDGLVGARGLTRMWLYEGRITDEPGFATLPRLAELALHGTRLDSLGFVRHLPELRHLELRDCGPIRSLAPVRGHGTLDRVVISGRTRIVDGDWTPLLDLPAAH